MKELKQGTKIKMKSLEDLREITGIHKVPFSRGGWQVKLPSGLIFKSWMLGMYGCRFEIEEVKHPDSMDRPSYSPKGARGNVWLTDELFDVVEE
jgi:hypothetical protein